MQNLIIIAHDIRSAHNVGALLRTADGFGAYVYLTGYTPYPKLKLSDGRLPHIAERLTRQIRKTALGAETNSQLWSHHEDIDTLIRELKGKDYEVVALEQDPSATPLPKFQPSERTAILLGREVEGIDPQLIKGCHQIVEIPMQGRKESFNVTEAATAALYHCTFRD